MAEPTIEQLAETIADALNEKAKRQWPGCSWSRTPGHYVWLAATAVHELLAETDPAAGVARPHGEPA